MKSNRSIYTAITILLLFTAHRSFAKTNTDDKQAGPSGKWFGINAGIGIDNYNFNHLNDQLSAAQLPGLKNNLITANISFVIMPGGDNRHFYDMTIGVANYSSKGGSVSYQQSARYGEFNFNYLLINKGRHKLYPAIGLGEMTASATYVDNTPEQNFANAVSNFAGERTFNLKTAIYGSVRIGYDFQLDKKGTFLLGQKQDIDLG